MKLAAAYLAIGAIAIFIIYLLKRGIGHYIRKSVFANLDNAYQNGYFNEGEQLHNASPDEIAYDMTCYAPDFEGNRPETLTPYVRKWMQQKGL